MGSTLRLSALAITIAVVLTAMVSPTAAQDGEEATTRRLPADADMGIDQDIHVRDGFYVTRAGVRVPIPERPEDENARHEPVGDVPAMQVLKKRDVDPG